MLAVVKSALSFVWGIGGMVLFIVLLLSAIRIYKVLRNRKA
jgi:putative membrane protein